MFLTPSLYQPHTTFSPARVLHDAEVIMASRSAAMARFSEGDRVRIVTILMPQAG